MQCKIDVGNEEFKATNINCSLGYHNVGLHEP